MDIGKIQFASKDNMPVEQFNVNGKESCLIYSGTAISKNGNISLPMWGRDNQLTFVCPYEVVIESFLIEHIKIKKKPHVLHMISIKSPQKIDIVIRDKNGEVGVEQLIIKSLMLSGRHRILNQRLGLYDCSQNNVDVIKSLGNALLRDFKASNARMLIDMKHYKDGVFSSNNKCPYCSGVAVYNYYMNDMLNPAKECSLCGWRGWDSFCNGKGEVIKIPLTKSVRNYLNSIGLANVEDKYEFMYKVGIKPYRLISVMRRFAIQDLKEARQVLRNEVRSKTTA